MADVWLKLREPHLPSSLMMTRNVKKLTTTALAEGITNLKRQLQPD